MIQVVKENMSNDKEGMLCKCSLQNSKWEIEIIYQLQERFSPFQIKEVA